MTYSKKIDTHTNITKHSKLDTQRITLQVDCPGNLSHRRILFVTIYKKLISTVVSEYTENDNSISIAYVLLTYGAI